MFKNYTSESITRLAHCITTEDSITKQIGKEATYKIVLAGKTITFKAYEDIEVGDYIVYLT